MTTYYKVTLEELQDLRESSFFKGSAIIDKIQSRTEQENFKEILERCKI